MEKIYAVQRASKADEYKYPGEGQSDLGERHAPCGPVYGEYNLEDKSLPILMPGRAGCVKINLESPAVIIPDMEFQVTEGDIVLVATGRVLKTGK
ncbi:MAG: hypothetical protein PUB63_01840 [Clostridia bacterium]|nr:hypothetical protein [Clostridia bacterium]